MHRKTERSAIEPTIYRLKTPNITKRHKSQTNQLQHPLSTSDRIAKRTLQILKRNNFIYIDVNQADNKRKDGYNEEGIINKLQIEQMIKEMQINNEEYESPDQKQEQIQFLSKNRFVTNLSNLSDQTQSNINYIIKLKELKKQRQLFQEKIRKAKQKKQREKKLNLKVKIKVKKTQNNIIPVQRNAVSLQNKNRSIVTLDNSALIQKASQKLFIHHGMTIAKLKQYLYQNQYKKLNDRIEKREKRLIQKYSIIKELNFGKNKSSALFSTIQQ